MSFLCTDAFLYFDVMHGIFPGISLLGVSQVGDLWKDPYGYPWGPRELCICRMYSWSGVRVPRRLQRLLPVSSSCNSCRIEPS